MSDLLWQGPLALVAILLASWPLWRRGRRAHRRGPLTMVVLRSSAQPLYDDRQVRFARRRRFHSSLAEPAMFKRIAVFLFFVLALLLVPVVFSRAAGAGGDGWQCDAAPDFKSGRGAITGRKPVRPA